MTRRGFLFSPAGAASPAGRRPNILFLLSDDQRHDTIRALGNPVIHTPNLDRLAKSGVSFTHCFVTNPICTPSRAGILTGCNDFRNGVRWFSDRIRPGLPLWPEVLRRAGYGTFYTGKWHNDGLPSERGFDIVRNLFPKGMGDHQMTLEDGGRNVSGFSSELFTDAAVDFLSSRPREPYFMYVAFTAPHDPRTPPGRYRTMYDPRQIPLPKNFRPEHPFDNGELRIRDEKLLPWPRTPEAVRREIAAYYGMISHMDEQIGRILTALDRGGQLERTLVIFSSDNGLALGSHGLLGKMSMYDHSVRVPLLIRAPGAGRPGGVSRALCYLHDVFPTVCDLAGVACPAGLDGRSLQPLLANQGAKVHDEICSSYREVQRMVRTGRWKLIYYPKLNRTQLFDISADPNEMNDLSGDLRYGKVLEELRRRLMAHQRKVGDPIFTARTAAPAGL